MLHLIQNHNTQQNIDSLMSVLESPLSSIFDKELLIIESAGISPLIEDALCRQVGVSAQLDFIYPADFFWRVIDSLQAEHLATNPADRAANNISHHSSLPESPSEPDKSNQDNTQQGKAAHGNAGHGSAKQSKAYNPYNPKRLQYFIFSVICRDQYITPYAGASLEYKWIISKELASLFDQYSKQNSPWFVDQQSPLYASWQGPLFDAVKQLVNAHTGQQFWLDGVTAFIQQPLQAASVTPLLPERLIVFQPKQLSPPYLSFLDQLAAHIDVYIFTVQSSVEWHQFSDVFNDDFSHMSSEMMNSSLADVAKEDAKENIEHSKTNDSAATSQGQTITPPRRTQYQLSELSRYRNQRIAQQLLIDLDSHTSTPITWHEPRPLTHSQHCLDHVKTLLVDADALQLKADTGHYQTLFEDGSIELVSCHSQLREVEVLYDYLIDLFAADPSLSYQDVMVCAPDIRHYQSLIESVFTPALQGSSDNKKDAKTASIRLDISDYDRSLMHVTRFLSQAIELSQHYYSAAKMMQLLALPLTKQMLGLSTSDLNAVSHWLSHLPVLQSKHTQLSAWQQAIKRLAMGVMTQSQSMIDEVLPFTTHSSDAVTLIAKLDAFISLLIGLHECPDSDLASEQFSGFKRFIKGTLLSSLSTPLIDLNGGSNHPYDPAITVAFSDDEGVVIDIKQVQQQLHGQLMTMEQMLRLDNEPGEGSAKTSAKTSVKKANKQQRSGDGIAVNRQQLISLWAESLLAQCQQTQPLMSDSLQLKSIAQAADLPAKVRILLGMNESYPAQHRPSGFDLRHDPSTSSQQKTQASLAYKQQSPLFTMVDEARHDFTQSLLNTDDKLYISYTGRTIEKNELRPASILVTELMRETEQLAALINHRVAPGIACETGLKVKQQPLHAHDHKYLAHADWPRHEPFLFNSYLKPSALKQPSSQRRSDTKLPRSGDLTAKFYLQPQTQTQAEDRVNPAHVSSATFQYPLAELIDQLNQPEIAFVKTQLGMKIYLPKVIAEQSTWQQPSLQHMRMREYQQALQQGMGLAQMIERGQVDDSIIGVRAHQHQQHMARCFEQQLAQQLTQQHWQSHHFNYQGRDIVGHYTVVNHELSEQASEHQQHHQQAGSYLFHSRLSQPYKTDMITLWMQHLFYHASTGIGLPSIMLTPEAADPEIEDLRLSEAVQLRPIENTETAVAMATELCDLILNQDQPLPYDRDLAKKVSAKKTLDLSALYSDWGAHNSRYVPEKNMIYQVDDYANSAVFKRLSELTFMQYSEHLHK